MNRQHDLWLSKLSRFTTFQPIEPKQLEIKA
jgi:hypothetical protein